MQLNELLEQLHQHPDFATASVRIWKIDPHTNEGAWVDVSGVDFEQPSDGVYNIYIK